MTIKITQSRSTGYEDGGQLQYTVSTVLSEAQEFSTYIMSKNPCALFLYQAGEYQKVVSMTEFDDYSALGPDTNGFLRKTSMSKAFSNAEQAIAYAKQQYEAITSFLLQLEDFSVTLDNSVETDIIPNTSNSLLYQTIQLYEANAKKIEDNEDKLIKAQAQYDSLISVNTQLSALFTKDNISQYKADLTQVINSISTAQATVLGVKNQASAAEASIAPAINTLTEAATYNNYSNGDWAIVNPVIDQTDTTKQNAYLRLNASIPQVSSKITSGISSINTAAIRATAVSAGTAESLLSQTVSSVNTTVSTILGKMNLVVGVTSGLTASANTLAETITSLQSERNGYLAEKNRLGAILTDLTGGSINLEDPMAIYNHRIFRFIS